MLEPRLDQSAEVPGIRPALGRSHVRREPILVDEHVVVGAEKQICGRVPQNTVSRV